MKTAGKLGLPLMMAAAMSQSAYHISNRYPDINFVHRKTKHNQRQRCTTYTPDSPEVKAMTKQFWQRADQLGKANYYCVCQSCGDSYQLGKEGETCQLCKSGKLYPQDVEPW
ncbi:hypothetical protein GRR94_04090 [Vibrio cholerae]|nr:hypothetical protein [Vibrio cholerae]